jgi:acetylglutamate kinase
MSTIDHTPISQADAIAKAEVLIDALPWLAHYSGATVVVKFGGNAMISDELKATFAEDMVFLRLAGLRPVVVHGGGPQISARLKELGIESEFKGGYRVTTTEAITVVRDVLRDEVNRDLVELINAHGDLAVGLDGQDGELFGGRRRGAMVDGAMVDLGHVGDVVTVNTRGVVDVLDSGRMPVISSIAPDEDRPGAFLNVNADAAASALAVALGARKLIVLTDVAGLYSDWPNRESLVSTIAAEELRALLPRLESGMIPKMTACLEAVDGGVENAAIIDGRLPHSTLLEVFTNKGIGTEVVKGLS